MKTKIQFAVLFSLQYVLFLLYHNHYHYFVANIECTFSNIIDIDFIQSNYQIIYRDRAKLEVSVGGVASQSNQLSKLYSATKSPLADS